MTKPARNKEQAILEAAEREFLDTVEKTENLTP